MKWFPFVFSLKWYMRCNAGELEEQTGEAAEPPRRQQDLQFRSVCPLCLSYNQGLETGYLLRLIFLHLLPHEELSHLWHIANLNRGM